MVVVATTLSTDVTGAPVVGACAVLSPLSPHAPASRAEESSTTALNLIPTTVDQSRDGVIPFCRGTPNRDIGKPSCLQVWLTPAVSPQSTDHRIVGQRHPIPGLSRFRRPPQGLALLAIHRISPLLRLSTHRGRSPPPASAPLPPPGSVQEVWVWTEVVAAPTSLVPGSKIRAVIV